MKVTRALIDEIVAHAREEAPNECCGLVASRGDVAERVLRAVNTEASPLRFRIAPEEQLELHNQISGAGLEIGAIYHSHTWAAPRPSQTDIDSAKLWPGVLWIIVGVSGNGIDAEVRMWRIDDGVVSEVDNQTGQAPDALSL